MVQPKQDHGRRALPHSDWLINAVLSSEGRITLHKGPYMLCSGESFRSDFLCQASDYHNKLGWLDRLRNMHLIAF